METISGSCLCGKVTFECTNHFHQFHLCHCVQCQKTSASAFAANLFTEPSNIKWLTGIKGIKRFDLPGRTISKAFCSECGVPYVSATGKALVVPAGSLDGKANLMPQDNIFYSEKAWWLEAGLCATAFQKFPK